MAGADRLDRGDAVHARQLQVHQHHVGPVPFVQLDRFGAIGGLALHAHVRLGAEHGGDALAQQRMVVDDEHADRLAGMGAGGIVIGHGSGGQAGLGLKIARSHVQRETLRLGR